MPVRTIEATDFDYVRNLVRDHAAIVLDDGKEYLVEARLYPVARREGFGSITELVDQLRQKPYNGLHEKVIDAMTTNETSFFRDGRPFQALKNHLLPEFLEKRAATKQIHIWCAASSSGQEPYTVAMLVHEFFASYPDWTVRILASDISEEMLTRCREACYSQIEINRGLPAQYLVKYFEKHGMEWHLQENIRRMVEFQRINLAHPWPTLPMVDIVFMRNILIYFDTETKKDILVRTREHLRSDGYLLLGGAETTLNLDDEYEQVYFGKASCYRQRQK